MNHPIINDLCLTLGHIAWAIWGTMMQNDLSLSCKLNLKLLKRRTKFKIQNWRHLNLIIFLLSQQQPMDFQKYGDKIKISDFEKRKLCLKLVLNYICVHVWKSSFFFVNPHIFVIGCRRMVLYANTWSNLSLLSSLQKASNRMLSSVNQFWSYFLTIFKLFITHGLTKQWST